MLHEEYIVISSHINVNVIESLQKMVGVLFGCHTYWVFCILVSTATRMSLSRFRSAACPSRVLREGPTPVDSSSTPAFSQVALAEWHSETTVV